ncbi:MAG: polyphenol oxidase family protein [Planctomycetes bacterium]|nr:polyphenol oxidase family protein [Planctomycetota bacterium]
MIRIASLAVGGRVGHAHSERDDGPVGSSAAPGWQAGRDALTRAAGGEPAALVVPHQVHGARVATVGAAERGQVIPATDGLATATPGVPLLVQGADCPLVMLADRAGSAVSVLHSGWRGTVARISAQGLRAMESLGAKASATDAVIFPGIGPCCFEIGPEVVDQFVAAFGSDAAAWTTPGRAGTDRAHLDLARAIRATLIECGVAEVRIHTVPGCTVCGGRLWSHRGSRGGPERHGLVALVLH